MSAWPPTRDRVPEGPAAQPILTAMAVGVALSGERAAESAELAERALREGGFRSGGLTAESWFIATWTLIFSDRPDLAESVARERLEASRREGHVREIFAVELTLACAALPPGRAAGRRLRRPGSPGDRGARAPTRPGPTESTRSRCSTAASSRPSRPPWRQRSPSTGTRTRPAASASSGRGRSYASSRGASRRPRPTSTC